MAKLTITDNQWDNVVSPIDADLDAAYRDGVERGSSVGVLDPLPYFNDDTKMDATTRAAVKDYARVLVAALVARLQVPSAFQPQAFVAGGLTTTVTYRKSDGVTNGTLTFTNGILTGST